MALINCPECNKEVSDKATSCIHCGCPLGTSYKVIDKRVHTANPEQGNQEQSKKGIGTFGIVVIVIAILGLLGSCVSMCGGGGGSSGGTCSTAGCSSPRQSGSMWCVSHTSQKRQNDPLWEKIR